MNIVEFARSLNLSIGTVSRALNNRPEVSPATRARVLAKAEELGFVRNPNARRLVMGSTFLIRLEYPRNTHVLSDRYLFELARGVEEATAAHGYDLLVHLGARRHAVDAGAAVDGIVVVATPDTGPEDLRRLTSSGETPAVVIVDSAPIDFQPAAYVCLDTLAGARAAVALLCRLGHVRIGYIGSGQNEDRLREVLPHLITETGITYNPALSVEAGISQEAGFSVAVTLLNRAERPTALLARTDVLACGAIQAAHRLGLHVPGDVSIIGHDNTEVASLVSPQLTTVSIDIPQVAEAAVGLLLNMISTHAEPAVQFHETRLVVRASCGPAPAAGREHGPAAAELTTAG